MIRRIDATTFQARIPTAVNHTTKPCNIKRGLKVASIYTLSTLAAYGVLSACSSDKKTVGQEEPVTPKTEQVVAPKQQQPESKLAPNGYYVVKENDNIWNIAKALLEEEKGAKNIMDTDIDKRKENIMRLNNLKYPSDTCDVVMIHPGETLYVNPHTYISKQIENATLEEHVEQLGTVLINSVPHI